MGSKKMRLLLGVLCLGCALGLADRALAQGEQSSGANTPASPAAGLKQELLSDRNQIKEQRQDIRGSAKEAIQEERNLMNQINQAIKAGDFEAAKGMKEKLKAVHQENVQQKHEDMQKLKEYRKDFKEDIRDKREDIRDRREDFRDRREDIKDRREDVRDRREDFRDKRDEHGVRDHGAGIGAGKGQGGMHRSENAHPGSRGGGGHKR